MAIPTPSEPPHLWCSQFCYHILYRPSSLFSFRKKREGLGRAPKISSALAGHRGHELLRGLPAQAWNDCPRENPGTSTWDHSGDSLQASASPCGSRQRPVRGHPVENFPGTPYARPPHADLGACFGRRLGASENTFDATSTRRLVRWRAGCQVRRPDSRAPHMRSHKVRKSVPALEKPRFVYCVSRIKVRTRSAQKFQAGQSVRTMVQHRQTPVAVSCRYAL